MRGEPQGGGGTRVEGEVGGREGVGGGQLGPGVKTKQGCRAGGVPQRGGGRDPGTENISIQSSLSSSSQYKSSSSSPVSRD